VNPKYIWWDRRKLGETIKNYRPEEDIWVGRIGEHNDMKNYHLHGCIKCVLKLRDPNWIPLEKEGTIPVVGNYIFFTDECPSEDIAGYVGQVIEIRGSPAIFAPNQDCKKGVINLHNALNKQLIRVVARDFHGFGEEVNNPVSMNREPTCPECGGQVGCFLGAPHCSRCDIIQLTDGWGRMTDRWVKRI